MLDRVKQVVVSLTLMGMAASLIGTDYWSINTFGQVPVVHSA